MEIKSIFLTQEFVIYVHVTCIENLFFIIMVNYYNFKVEIIIIKKNVL